MSATVTIPSPINIELTVEQLAIALRQLDKNTLDALLIEVEKRGAPDKSRSVLELRGLGKEVWKEIDVDAYIENERNSWDG